MRVLDVACGTGAFALVAFGQEYSGSRAAISPRYCWQKPGEKKSMILERTPYCQLGAEGLPYDDGSFDAVISGSSFAALPNLRAAFDGMLKATKPGGLLCIGAQGGKPL